MGQYAMVIDLNKCVGCHACALACRAEWGVPVPYHRSWVDRLGPEKTPKGMSYTFHPALCNHCDHPICVEACVAEPVEKEFTDPKTGKKVKMMVKATYKHPFTGIVLVDKDRCLGCGACAVACPYGARYVDKTRAKPVVDKCTFCFERLEYGKEPACVRTCIADARIFGDITDKNSEVYKLVHEKGAVPLVTKDIDLGPNVYYLGQEKDIFLLKKLCSPKKTPWISQNLEAPARRELLKTAAKKLLDFEKV